MFVAWVAIGVVAAIVIGRRGHAPFTWLILGTVLGPLVLPLALARDRDAAALPMGSNAGEWVGPVDVLVGIDGSRQSNQAVAAALHLFGDRLGRLTLAAVVDYDAALGGAVAPGQREARRALEEVQNSLNASLSSDTVVLSGVAGEVLLAHAQAGGYDVIAVGRRGRGASKAIIGSVASSLSRTSTTPVLIVAEDTSVSAAS
jgi:nucleotide-binding universal stress UspA family protein